MRLKNIYGENSNLFAYVRFCGREEKKIEKREKSHNGNVLNTDVPTTRLMY